MPRLGNNARHLLAVATVALLGLTAGGRVHGQADAIPDVGIDQRLDVQLPLELPFRDEDGERVVLGDILDGSQPAVLALVYYDCTMLCGEVLQGMLEVFRDLELGLGTDFQAVTISFDPAETHATAAPKKRIFVNAYGREDADGEAGWHFLTDADNSAKALADLVGFRYAYLPEIDEYAHGSAIIVLTPGGKVSRYFYGIAYPARELRLALVDAGEGKIGTLADQLMLLCMYYDPESGVYTLAVMRIVQIAGGVTAASLGLFVMAMLVRERRHAADAMACES